MKRQAFTGVLCAVAMLLLFAVCTGCGKAPAAEETPVSSAPAIELATAKTLSGTWNLTEIATSEKTYTLAEYATEQGLSATELIATITLLENGTGELLLAGEFLPLTYTAVGDTITFSTVSVLEDGTEVTTAPQYTLNAQKLTLTHTDSKTKLSSIFHKVVPQSEATASEASSLPQENDEAQPDQEATT